MVFCWLGAISLACLEERYHLAVCHLALSAIYVHFHWVFPRKFGRLPKLFWWSFYTAGFGLAIAEWLELFPSSTYFTGFAFAIVISILLLLAHLIFQKEYRRDVGVLGLAVGLILLPSLVFSLVSLLGIEAPAFSGGSFLAFPALPGAYFLIAYRRQFQELDQRLKRLTRIYLAIIIGGTLLITLLMLANISGNLTGSTLGIGIVVTLIAAISAITGFSPFLALPALTGERISLKVGSGDLEIRANRLLSLYLFAILVGLPLTLGIIIADSLWDFPGEIAIIGISAALVGSLLTAVGFTPFQRFVDRRILGIQLPPEELIQSYSDRITTRLDKTSLVHLLQDDLLPSLLVRRSVLLQMSETGVKPFASLGLGDEQIPKKADIPALASQAGKLLGFDPEAPETLAWVRLALPLEIGGNMIGLWLFGSRDPDDFYALEEIELLKTLANQTAIALVNIKQAERLHILYQSNIDWHEEERNALARELHDDVLGQLAVLSTQSDAVSSPEFQESYQLVSNRLRQIVSNLRPAMLQYGLYLALDELTDELPKRFSNGTS